MQDLLNYLFFLGFLCRPTHTDRENILGWAPVPYVTAASPGIKAIPQLGHDQRVGAPFLQRHAETVGVVQLGEDKAPRRPYCSLPVLIRKMKGYFS